MSRRRNLVLAALVGILFGLTISPGNSAVVLVDSTGITALASGGLMGDADGDGAVNDDDLSVLLANWGGANPDWQKGDFNGDGKVDDDDLSLLLANWSKLSLDNRWIYLSTNMLVDANVTSAITLINRAATAGYTGIVLTDSKFMRWDILPAKYETNVKQVVAAIRAKNMKVVACVAPVGYSNDMLSRDPNLAAGYPVQNAEFTVTAGKLVPTGTFPLLNGSFETYTGNTPTGWAWVDQPGSISFIDTAVKYAGNASLRMQNIGGGNGRACQVINVEPYKYYHVSVAIKTDAFAATGSVRVNIIGADGYILNHKDVTPAATQDWKVYDVCFNTLNNTRINFYVGCWGGTTGKIWWDDVKVAPAGFMNVLRRGGCPLKITSSNGQTTYTEGTDFAQVRDTLLGVQPYAGEYSVWHAEPTVTVPAGSRLTEGQKVLASYYHPVIIYWGQVGCCLSEQKVYDTIQWQIDQVKRVIKPDGYFMSHDEIRCDGWDESCTTRNLKAGQILADNVSRITDMIKTTDPGKDIYVWSDMFDPTHNAQATGKYYLVKGDGPWHESWLGLTKDVTIVTWRQNNLTSLQHFASRGHKQILAGYYDAPVGNIVPWLQKAQQVSGVVGVMYTTWVANFTNIEAWIAEVNKFK